MKINIIALTILISCYLLVVSSQDFQWLAEQETSFMEVSGNGDIYVVAQLPSNGDVDPGVDEWILDINVISWYLSKYNSSGSFEWAYGFQEMFRYQLSNELETTSPSLVMNPEDNGLCWVGSFSGSMDLDPTAGTFNKTTNINTLSGSAQTHVSAVCFTEFDLDGDLVKINYMNSDPSVLFDKFRTNENRDFYMLAGGSHRNFDHNFGLAEYYDSTLTRSYIALYDGVRIPEALGDEEVVSETSIRFGPNPTQGIIRFSETPDQIHAYDLSGRLLQFPISSNTIDLGNAPAGLCILEVEANGSREVFKVQKL